jgi:large subunit ribosomal protein L29
MKAKERETLRNHSTAELRAELTQIREKLFRLKFKHGVAPAKNPLELRNLRRHAARLETWINEKRAAPAPQAGAVAPAKS